MTLDAELLAAFIPEFEAEAARLATAQDTAAALRPLSQLRAMAGALEEASLVPLLDRAMAAADPFDAAALAVAAEALAARARALLAPTASPSEPPPSTAAPVCRVLVVDDSAMMRRLVRETLASDPDFDVVGEAPDGRQALAMMAALAPGLVMLDIEMPELGGIGVLQEMALRGGAPVVVVSSAARPGSAVALEARRLGAAAIVAKPSGALSPDLRVRQGAMLLRAARRAAGLPEHAQP